MSGNIFPGQQPNEQFIFFFRKHWIELFYPVGRFLLEQLLLLIFVLVMHGVGTVWISTVEGHITIIFLVVALIVSTISFWIRVFNYFLRVVIVTDYRIIDVKQRLFVTDDEDVIDLREIQDLKGEIHGFWSNIIGCGMMTFVLTASSMPKVLHNVPHTREMVKRMSEVREIYKKLSGAHPVSLPTNPSSLEKK